MTTSTETGHGRASNTPKVDIYKWGVKDVPGRFVWVPKGLINIDHEYQRDKISNIRVLEIARDWSWIACGCLLLAKRYDGTLWAMDGQHRKLAADKRSDVQELPCMVFDITDKKDEAKGFINSNTVRGPVLMIDRFKGMLLAGNEIAIGVKKMVEASNYQISRNAGSYHVGCVDALMREYQVNSEVAVNMWELSAAIFNGEMVTDKVYKALCFLERFLKKNALGSLTQKHYRDALLNAGVQGIMQRINQSVAFYGVGGVRPAAEGLVCLLNWKKRTRRIPSLMGVSNSDDEQSEPVSNGEVVE